MFVAYLYLRLVCETDSTSKVRSAAWFGKAISTNMIFCFFFSAPNARLSHEHYEVPALPWSLYSFLIHMEKK